MSIHHGRCHCGDTRFEIEADIDQLRECDCSICRRRGTLNFRVNDNEIRFLTPLDRLRVYRWGTGTAADYFCPICGVMPFRRPSAPTKEEQDAGMARFEGWAVNVRCIDDLDLDSLPRIHIAGSSLTI
ncbi:GFA family protein [Rhodopseudomonas boonkerdii]|uniref:GFA family protein n=1 Tax=Rhodopseudomonas boonkerdii TaxID=475937 RepID=UPI001E62F38B|nr:GFA family protein [Rhodopseudomonas boonkerdii]UGV28483.1 GFA family protein [Rhodopseudomonas boonkerdii]